MLHFLWLIIYLSLAYSAFGDSPLEVIIPQSKRSLVNVQCSSIVGNYDTSRVRIIQLLVPFQTKKFIAVSTKEDKENFPRIIRQMFPDNLLLEKVTLNLEKKKGSRDTVQYRFSLNDEVELKKFWTSSSFREILAVVYDTKTIACEATLQGKLRKDIDVTEKEYRQKYGRTFSVSVPLQPGINNFLLRSLSRDGHVLGIDTVGFFSQTKVQRDTPPEQFQHQPFHSDSSESQCTACHSLALTT